MSSPTTFITLFHDTDLSMKTSEFSQNLSEVSGLELKLKTDNEIVRLENLVKMKDQEKARVVEVMIGEIKACQAQYRENRMFLLNTFDNIIESKNKLWLEKSNLQNYMKSPDKGHREKISPPLTIKKKDQSTSPMPHNMILESTCHISISQPSHNPSKNIIKPSKIPKAQCPSPISHHIKKFSKRLK